MDIDHSRRQGPPLLSQCLERLREREANLNARGIIHAAILGSVARCDAGENSDIDILVEIQRTSGRKFDFSDLFQLQRYLAEAFGRPVDVVTKGGLKFPKHDAILAEMIQVF